MSPEGPVSGGEPTPGGLERVRVWMFAPENAAGLAAYRMLWGVLMAIDAVRYIRAGWVYKYYVEPPFLFKFIGFAWVEPMGRGGMGAVYIAMLVAALAVAIGFGYRAASTVYFVAHTYAFLLSPSHYLNHAYLISLLAFLMIFLPADRALSVRAWLWPSTARREIARWPRALLLAQLGIVYTYGGIAKLNADWLIYHQPVRKWMAGAAKRVPLASDLIRTEAFTQLVAYGGVAFDLLIFPALLWRKTRPLAVVAAVSFHVSNEFLFRIGMFPYLMLAATTLFFASDWPCRIPGAGRYVRAALARGASRVPVSAKLQRLIAWATAVWLVVQVLVPLRQHLYPNEVDWTEDGHMFAWRMKLRSKRGTVTFRVVDPENSSWAVDPADELSKRQVRKLAGHPDFIRQYANHLAERYRGELGHDVEVYADARCSLNYRRKQRFIDPDYDLANTRGSLRPSDWVLPFTWTPPPRRKAKWRGHKR